MISWRRFVDSFSLYYWNIEILDMLLRNLFILSCFKKLNQKWYNFLDILKFRNGQWYLFPFNLSEQHTLKNKTEEITLKNNTEETNNKCYTFASSALLCLFFTSYFKKDDNYLAPPESFFAPPGCVALATALDRGSAHRPPYLRGWVLRPPVLRSG